MDKALAYIDEGVRRKEAHRIMQERFLKKRAEKATERCAELERENACLHEQLGEAGKWKMRYMKVKSFFSEAFFYDIGMKKELLKVALAVDDKEWVQQLRDSLKEDLRPQGMVVGNMYGGVVGDTVNG